MPRKQSLLDVDHPLAPTNPAHYLRSEEHTYRVKNKIGEGSFSVVHTAARNRDQRVVALKAIKNAQDAVRIRDEMRALRLLEGCKHVVHLVDVILHQQQFVILVMPYFEHHSFTHALHHNRFDQTHTRAYMRGLFMALKHIHDRDFIHRDIKPSNVLYNFDTQQTMVVDFGLVQRVARPVAMGKTGASFLSDDNSKGPNCDYKSQHTPPNKGERSREEHLAPCHADTQVVVRRVVRPRTSPIAGGLANRREEPELRRKVAKREGTAGFRAPEVLIKSEKQGFALDIWSAGIIFLCFLLRRYPIFSAPSDDAALVEILSLMDLLGGERKAEAAWAGCAELLGTRISVSRGGLGASAQWRGALGVGGASLQEQRVALNSQLDASGSAATFLLRRCLSLDPSCRASAAEILKMPYFVDPLLQCVSPQVQCSESETGL